MLKLPKLRVVNIKENDGRDEFNYDILENLL
jgi:hypothetical protein